MQWSLLLAIPLAPLLLRPLPPTITLLPSLPPILAILLKDLALRNRLAKVPRNLLTKVPLNATLVRNNRLTLGKDPQGTQIDSGLPMDVPSVATVTMSVIATAIVPRFAATQKSMSCGHPRLLSLALSTNLLIQTPSSVR
jgi:hypothetical protein